jgi:hypothetical protein
MSLTLQNFDEKSDDVTQRGREYFASGAVTSLDDAGHGEWLATVLGTQEYTVEVTLKKNIVSSTDCPCYFFEANQYCKHVVATLYAIRDHKEKLTGGKKTKEPKIKSPLQMLQQSADAMSPEHLRNFIKTHAVHNKDFTNNFLFYAKQIDVQVDSSIDSFRSLIRQAIVSSTQRSKKKDHRDDDILVAYIRPLLVQIRSYIAENNYLDSTAIVKAMIEELLLLRESSFTGDKTLKLFVQAFELLQSIAASDVPFTFLDELFEYCFTKAQDKLFSQTVLEMPFYRLLMHLAIDNQKRTLLLDLLAAKVTASRPVSATSYGYSYHQDWIDYLYLQLDLLQLMNRHEEAWTLLKTNATYHEEVLRKAVEYAIDHKEYLYAKQLIEQRLSEMRSADNLYRYHKRPWDILLLRIAEAENDKTQIIELALSLLLDTMDMSYYRLARKQSNATDWKSQVQSLIQKIESRHLSVEFLGKVYAEERMTEELFQLMKKYQNIYLLRSFSDLLIPAHKQEVFAIYRSAIEAFAVEAFTSNYPTIRDHLNHMIDLGGLKTVKEIVTHFRNIYKGRPKFLEQLSKVKIPS